MVGMTLTKSNQIKTELVEMYIIIKFGKTQQQI